MRKLTLFCIILLSFCLVSSIASAQRFTPLDIISNFFNTILKTLGLNAATTAEKTIPSSGSIVYSPTDILNIKRFVYAKYSWTPSKYASLTDVYNTHFNYCYGRGDDGSYDVLIPPLIREIRPNDYYCLLYRNVRACYKDAEELNLFKENGWILKDSAGKELTSGDFGYYYVDIGNPDYREWLANWYKTWLVKQNWNGIYLDNGLDASKGELWWDCGGNYPINPRTGKIWEPEEIRDAYIAIYKKIREVVGPEYIITANGIYDGDRWFLHTGKKEIYIEELKGVNGVLHEGWLTTEMNWYNDPANGDYSFKEGWYSEDKWKRSLDMIIEIDNLYPNMIHIMDELACDKIDLPAPIPDSMPELRKQYTTYVYSSLLLSASTTNQYFLGLGWWGAENMQNLWQTDVGSPLEIYKKIEGTNVYERDFSKAKVLVNPTDQISSLINLGGNYRKLDGTAVSSITMNAHTGEILSKII